MQRVVFCRSFCGLLLIAASISAQTRVRARDLGIPFTGTPGPTNSIVDVTGVTVGQTTLIEGSDVRTGVTAVWPRGEGNQRSGIRRCMERLERQWRDDGDDVDRGSPAFSTARCFSRTRTASG